MTGALGIPNLYAFARFTYLNGDADYRASGGPCFQTLTVPEYETKTSVSVLD
jgi:hypothetical protein